jgi:N-carbamoylputrescine amidase
MKLALIQQVAAHDKSDNVRRGLEALERAARDGANLAVFAELAFERFYPQRPAAPGSWRLGEPVPGPTTDAFCRKARELGIVVVLNLYERDGTRGFDCSPVIDADGTLLGRTRMVHITDYACFHEQGYYAPGDTGAPVFSTHAGAIGVAICYDRHYPEYMRALAVAGADLVVIPQAGALDEWPEGLYESEVRVAAFQNGYFVALCNRVGEEECLTFAGESFVAAPDGRILARAAKLDEAILYADINLADAASSHARRLFLQHRRPELYAGWLSSQRVAPTAGTPVKK